MKKKVITFDEAWAELQQIHANLQANLTISVAEISALNKRANELITFCKAELRAIQEELKV